MGSQRGGRGKVRGFSFGVVVDEDIFVAMVLEIVGGFRCMYGFGCFDGREIDGVFGGSCTKMMLTFLWLDFGTLGGSIEASPLLLSPSSQQKKSTVQYT